MKQVLFAFVVALMPAFVHADHIYRWVDEHGVLRRAWYRELDADVAAELEATIDGLGATAAAPAPR